MMPLGCCCCSTTRHGVTAGGKGIVILLVVIAVCTPIIADREDSSSDDEEGMIQGQTPTLNTVWLATYNAMKTETVSSECGKHYASYFLQEFLNSIDRLQAMCPSENTSIAISSVARVRLLVSKNSGSKCGVTLSDEEVSLDTFLHIHGTNRSAIIDCLQRLNTSFQDINKIAQVRTIPNNTEHNCSEVTMATDVLEWTDCKWECKASGYVYHGSNSCSAKNTSVTWNCTMTCEEAFTTCLHGLTGRAGICAKITRGLECIRLRRKRQPIRYFYCWEEIKKPVLKKISEARSEGCTVDDTGIDPTDDMCTTSPVTPTTDPSTLSTTTTEKTTSPSTLTSTLGSTAAPLEWSMKLVKMDNDAVEDEGPYVMELLEGGAVKNVTFMVTINKEGVCKNIQSCSIFFDVKFTDHATPMCRKTKVAISQVVIGRPWIDGELVPETAESNFCELDLTRSTKLEVDSEAPIMITIPLKARVDNKYDGFQTRKMTLSFRRQIMNEKVFKESMEVEISINVIDRDSIATCDSINDPHIKTFDGFTYDNFFQGEFILYRSTKYPFQVNVLYQSCDINVKASCNCAVAVKNGDDVFVFDRCRKIKRKFNGLGGNKDVNIYKTTLYRNGELTPGTSLRDGGEGKKYILYLPTGTYIKILLNGDLLNVWIVASTNDIGHTEGLCGTYDTDMENDLKLRNGSLSTNADKFSVDWRVPLYGSESLMNGDAASSDIYEPNVYCQCGMNGNVCEFDLDVETCDIYEGDAVTEVFVNTSISPQPGQPSRQKRDTSNVITVDEPIQVDPNFIPPIYDWENEVVKMNAYSFCENYIRENEVGKLCSMIPGVDFRQQVNTCMEDIKITKVDSWADSANDAMKESCLEQIKKNGSIPDDLANSITGAICISDCSGHGSCKQGECVCDPDWGGADCSIPLDAPPVIAELPKYGLCDRSVSDCNRVIVYGEKFLNTPELVCLLTSAIIYTSNYSLGNTSKEDAEFINFNAVECPIPIIKPYLISVSNDNGVTESEPLLYIPYDSSCRDCSTNNTGCQLKLESCYIQDNCYKKGDESEGDSCLVCRPERDARKWSQADTCSNPLLSDVVVATIAAIVGSAVGLALGILLYILCCKSRKSDDNEVQMSTRDSGQFSPTLQPIDDEMLHRNNHVVPNEFPENFGGSGRNNFPDYFQEYNQGVENGVDDTTYF